MLGPRHAADLRRDRVFASLVLAVVLVLLGATVTLVVQWPSAWVGALMVTAGMVPVAIAAVSAMRVHSLCLVFDRPVGRADRLPYSEQEQLRMHLTRVLAEVDAQLVELGLEPLESYLELELAPGVARHDAAVASANLERLLAVRGASFDATTRRAQEQLARKLAHAAEQGARFCLMPVSSWSGMIECNLGLYLGG